MRGQDKRRRMMDNPDTGESIADDAWDQVAIEIPIRISRSPTQAETIQGLHGPNWSAWIKEQAEQLALPYLHARAGFKA